MDSPVIVFLISVFAVPGVTSLITSAIRTISDSLGVKPQTVVYVASLAVVGAILAFSGVELPTWAGSGPAYIAAWLALATANSKLSEMVYDLLLSRLYPTTA